MTVDLIKNAKPDKELIELSLVPYMLWLALRVVNKKEPGTISDGLLEVLDQSAAVPFTKINKKRIPKLVKMVEDATRLAFREARAISTNKELALAVAMLNLDLVKDNKFLDARNQGVLVAALLVEEAMDFQDVGNIKKCKSASGTMRNCLNRLGYFA